MYTCDVCGEEFETLTRMRLEHDPCPVEQERREHQQAVEQVEQQHGYGVGDRARLLDEGREVEVVDVEPGDDEPTVVWVDPDEEDEPENRGRSPASDVI
jgi:hypothetical protein